MSDEYDYGPWIGWNNDRNPPHLGETVQVIMFGGLGQLRWENMKSHDVAWARGNIIAYRIATPKPKRELVVGKWYRSGAGNWRRVIAIEHNNERSAVWMVPLNSPDEAVLWRMSSALDVIDWSTPPRDEAPE